MSERPPEIPALDPSLAEGPKGSGDELRRKRFLTIVNPVSGPRGNKPPARELRERAAKLGLDLDIVETTPELDGRDAALSKNATDYEALLVWGGDGTIMEVASVAIETGVPLAVIPRGTANAVAWHFGLPFDVQRALQTAMRGRVVRIDVARTGEQNFLVLAGLGFDAAVISSATRSLKRRFGFLAYLVAASRNLGRRPYTFRISLDGREPFRVRGVTAGITNLGTLAGNFRPVNPVSPQDGLLDIIVVAQANFAAFFRIFFWSLLGRLHQDPRVNHFQARKARIETRPLAPLQIDGDEIPGRHRELSAEVMPSALAIVVPPDWMLKVPWLPDVPWRQPGINTPPGTHFRGLDKHPGKPGEGKPETRAQG